MQFVKRMKCLVPMPLRERVWRVMEHIEARRRAARFKHLTTQEIFSEIYDQGLWGKSKDPGQRYFSGTGTHNETVASVYIKSACDFLQSLPSKPVVVDLGCGDFTIGSKIRPMAAAYIACDIVPKVIEFNKVKYRSMQVDFRVLDLITDTLPPGDVVFIRQVLQHLSNQQIEQVVPKLKSTYRYLVLTEHLPDSPDFVPNLDRPTGSDIRLELGSGIVLSKPPFNLVAKAERVLCEASELGGIIRTTVYTL